MGRKKQPGRGEGGRRGGSGRGRASFLAPIDEEIFQDLSDGDTDVALEEKGFVVSSPAMLNRVIGSANPVEVDNTIGSGEKSMGRLAKEDAASPAKEAVATVVNPSQKWGDQVETEGIEELPKGVDAVDPKQQPEVPVKERKTWASVVGNSDPSRGMQLNYVPPVDGIVEFTEDDIAAGVEAWSSAVVGQIVGGNPSFKEVVGFVHRAWSRIEIPRVHQMQPGVFLFNFQSEESKSKVMARNWNLNHEPWLMSDWTPDYKPETKKPTRRKVWVRLPGLKLHFWTKQGLEKIASGIGIPLATDMLTARKDEIKFARVLVDIDLMKPKPSEIKCKLPNGGFYDQKIEYENLPENPSWEVNREELRKEKGKKSEEIVIPIINQSQASQSSNAITPSSGAETKNQKKKRKRKKKGTTPPVDNSESQTQIHVTRSVRIGSEALFANEPGQAGNGTEGISNGKGLPQEPPDPGGNKVPNSTSFK